MLWLDLVQHTRVKRCITWYLTRGGNIANKKILPSREKKWNFSRKTEDSVLCLYCATTTLYFHPTRMRRQWCGSWETIQDNTSSYLFQPAALGAYVGQRVVLVDIGDHWGHFVTGFREQRNPTDHLGHPERRVHIQSAEIVIDGQELYEAKRQASLVSLEMVKSFTKTWCSLSRESWNSVYKL